MIDPENLNPLDVLAHLNQLGYHNISPKQLKDFMHDLKILIKYEQKYGKFNCSLSDGDESNSSVVNTSFLEDSEKETKSEESLASSTTNSSELCTNCNNSTSDSDAYMSDVSCVRDSDNRQNKLISFSQQTNRPQSSFIRPWRLQPCYKASTIGASLKCDPVQLYHKYKGLWSQQKVPGENSHSQLRWTIREKMLGQDPHPRPISQASTEYRSRSVCHK